MGLGQSEQRQSDRIEVSEIAGARSTGLCRLQIGTLDFLFWKVTGSLEAED